MTLAGTAFVATMLVLTAMYAGPLWRDEVNTANVAQMSSLQELWGNLAFESFPPLWPLLLRGCDLVGLTDSDVGIRLLGLYVGLFFLVSLWLCSRWMGGRAPIMSIALLGSLPAFVFIMGANRAYGLASCLLVLSFGTIWRLVEFPSRSRMLWAAFTCLLFVQCVYYDIVFLCAMLAGAAIVALRRRHWKTLVVLTGIGAISVASLLIYLPIIHQGSLYVPMNQYPSFGFSILWSRICQTVSMHSSASLGSSNGPEVWFWVGLLLSGLIVALVTQRKHTGQGVNLESAPSDDCQTRRDRALFCGVSMLIGVLGQLTFLYRLHFWTQTWYYVEMLCLCAVSLDGLAGANWPALRPWGWLRVGFMVLLMGWGSEAVWTEAHTRRSNVDLIATILAERAGEQDFIVVEKAWEGITFERYYNGRAHWVTVPPVDSHKVHRSDLLYDKMNQPDVMLPVLREMAATLQNGNSVWVVGNMTALQPASPPASQPVKWVGTYFTFWSAQVSSFLLKHASHEQVLQIPVDEPVCELENLPVRRFTGYKSEAN